MLTVWYSLMRLNIWKKSSRSSDCVLWIYYGHNFPHGRDTALLYSLTIATSLVSMALTVDMALFTLTIVALAVGALKVQKETGEPIEMPEMLWHLRPLLAYKTLYT